MRLASVRSALHVVVDDVVPLPFLYHYQKQLHRVPEVDPEAFKGMADEMQGTMKDILSGKFTIAAANGDDSPSAMSPGRRSSVGSPQKQQPKKEAEAESAEDTDSKAGDPYGEPKTVGGGNAKERVRFAVLQSLVFLLCPVW